MKPGERVSFASRVGKTVKKAARGVFRRKTPQERFVAALPDLRIVRTEKGPQLIMSGKNAANAIRLSADPKIASNKKATLMELYQEAFMVAGESKAMQRTLDTATRIRKNCQAIEKKLKPSKKGAKSRVLYASAMISPEAVEKIRALITRIEQLKTRPMAEME